MLTTGSVITTRALTELELAKQLLPNEARIYMLAGAVDRRSGRCRKRKRTSNARWNLDPRNFVVVLEAGSTFQGMRRYAEADVIV